VLGVLFMNRGNPLASAKAGLRGIFVTQSNDFALGRCYLTFAPCHRSYVCVASTAAARASCVTQLQLDLQPQYFFHQPPDMLLCPCFIFSTCPSLSCPTHFHRCHVRPTFIVVVSDLLLLLSYPTHFHHCLIRPTFILSHKHNCRSRFQRFFTVNITSASV
jgi:hypothetical protein